MKVCFAFASHGIGGAERNMLKVIRATHPGLIECSFIDCGPVYSPDLQATVEAAGLKFNRIPLWNVPKLRHCLRRIRPDIVYLFGIRTMTVVALAAKLAGVHCLVYAERASLDRKADWIGYQLTRKLIDAYISNSRFAARQMREWIGIPEEKIFVAYNGIEITESEGPTVEDDSFGNPTILCAANIAPRKGHLTLLRAIKLLRETYPKIRAVLVGRDDTQGTFFKEASVLGLDDTYVWTGFVPDIGPYLKRATLMVLPSLWGEGMPTSVLEAMAAELPIIATDVAGVGELIEDGHTGLLISPNDSATLAQKIQFLLEHEEYRRRLAEQARSHVREHHSLEVMVGKHYQVFKSLLANQQNHQTKMSVDRFPQRYRS
jgi:glycosyltransferase involved in cell wall biosynthesis